METFLSLEENNKILKILLTPDICFSCKQKRLSIDDFYTYYEKASKHYRMKCLLSVSGFEFIRDDKL